MTYYTDADIEMSQAHESANAYAVAERNARYSTVRLTNDMRRSIVHSVYQAAYFGGSWFDALVTEAEDCGIDPGDPALQAACYDAASAASKANAPEPHRYTPTI